MNQGLPSPGVGLAAPNDPRLISRLAQPHGGISYINNKPPQMTIPRLVPSNSTTAPAASATSFFTQAVATNSPSSTHDYARKDNNSEQLVNNLTNNTTMRKGPQIKMKSRPKKNQSFDNISDSQPSNGQQDPEPSSPTKSKPLILGSGSLSSRPSPLSHIIRHLPAFQSPTKASTQSATTTNSQVLTAATPATSAVATTLTNSNGNQGSKNEPIDSKPDIKPQNTNGASGIRNDGISKTTIGSPQSLPAKQHIVQQSSPSSHNPQQQPSTPSSFSWDIYLERMPAQQAPKEAFKQDTQILNNHFKPGMKLEARDPRNGATWCLATIQMMEGPRLRLRFDGGDSMNDFFELINSENIRPVNSNPNEQLLPPMAFKGSLSTYPKFVEKVLMKPDTVVASPEFFISPPRTPEKNLFKQGMKLEAIDKKNPYLICPATVGEVIGDDIKILFDGWKGSFDYICKYHSRDIFPVNWCRDNNHYIAAPNGWENLISNTPPKSGKQTSRLDRLSTSSPKTPSRPVSQNRTPSKEVHMAKVQLLPKNTPVTSPAPTPKIQSRPSPKNKDLKRKRSLTPEPSPIREPSSVDAGFEPPNVDGELETIDDQDDTDIDQEFSPELKFQCQRTVPYDEWVKVHRSAVASFSSATTIKTGARSTTSNSSTIIDDPSSSVNGSDSASTSANPEPPRRGRPPKKIRLDPEVDRLLVAFPPGPYNSWSVSQVLEVIKIDETLEKYSPIFETHEIDGKAFGLLTTDLMISHMGLKIGPVLKIAELIEKVKRLRRFATR